MTGPVEASPRGPLEPSEGTPPGLPPRPARESGSSGVRTLSTGSGSAVRACAVCHAPLEGRAHRSTCSPACRRARSRLREDAARGVLQRQVRALQQEVLGLRLQLLDGHFVKLEAEMRARRGAGQDPSGAEQSGH
jgi:hypothetical protein